MTVSSRRRARRQRQQRETEAEARAAARHAAELEAGQRGRRYRSKDRRDISWLRREPGEKQRRKHRDKRLHQLLARRDARRAALEAQLVAATEGAPAQVTTLKHAGGFCPFTASGTARLADGRELSWTFRFRYDRAFLEVGTLEPEYHLVDECALAASWDDVTGEDYAGTLTHAQALRVLSALFAALAPPEAGARFQERMANTLDLVLGRGGNPEAPTLVR